MSALAQDANTQKVLTFRPRPLEQVKLGSKTYNMYPTVVPSMPEVERGFAFNQIWNELMLQPAERRLVIDAFGTRLGVTATVNAVTCNFMRHYENNTFNMALISIGSFHDSSGAVLNDAATPEDRQVLKAVEPMQDEADRRPADVAFAKLNLTLDFSALMNDLDEPPANTVLRASYFLNLPQTTVDVLDDEGELVALTTYHGPADLRTLNPEQIKAEILDAVHQERPVWLKPAQFAGQDAVMIDEEPYRAYEERVLSIALPVIKRRAFKVLCPQHKVNPDYVVKHLRQTFVDAEGNQVTLPVQEYVHDMMTGSIPFASMETYPCDLMKLTIDGLDSRVRAHFNELYPDHAADNPKDSHTQQVGMENILLKATIAEAKLRATQDTVTSMLGGAAQTLHVAQAYPTTGSQCERTLQQYEQPGAGWARGPRRDPDCFGCGGNHRFREPGKNGKPGKILCPNAHLPGVAAKATKNHAEYMKRLKQRQADKKAASKRNRKGDQDFSDMSPAQQKRIREQVYQLDAAEDMSIASSVTTPTIGSRGRGAGLQRQASGAGSSNPLVFVVTAVTLNLRGSGRKMPLPVKISSNFPHIRLQTGSPGEEAKSPFIRGIVDTAAALTTVNVFWARDLITACPWIVVGIYCGKECESILLSGVVQSGGSAHTTELDIAIKIQLGYSTKDGAPIQLVMACGRDVSANCIFGLPFLQAAGAVVDLIDHVVEMKNLACEPFPIEYARSMVSVPNHSRSNISVNLNDYPDVLRQIEHLDAYVATACASPPEPRKRIRWGPRVDGQPDADSAIDAAATSVNALDIGAMGGPPLLDDYRDPMMDTDMDISHDSSIQ